MLVRAGRVVVLVPLNVRGFCLVLARGWHEGLRKLMPCADQIDNQ
jgi:hypothetical protein